MSDIFEKLRKIAKEEFGCTLIQGQSKRTFKDVFGFGAEDIVDFDGFKELLDMEHTTYQSISPQFDSVLVDNYELDSFASTCVSLAA